MTILDYFNISTNTLYYTPIILFVYVMSLEFGRGMGNIWLRTNQIGDKVFSFGGLSQFFYKPFIDMTLWIYPQIWSLNPYIYCYTVLKIVDIISNNYLSTYQFDIIKNETS